MYTYCYLDKDPTVCQLPRQYDLTRLHPFDALKVSLEQIFLYKYLWLTADAESVIGDLFNKIKADLSLLPTTLTGDNSEALASLYQSGIQAAQDWLGNSSNMWEHINPAELFAIFYTPNQREYVNREYTSTMTEDFLTVILAHCFGYFDVEKYSDRILHEAALYYPTIEVKKLYDPNVVSTAENAPSTMVIAFKPIACGGVDLEFTDQCSEKWITAYNLSQHTVDELVGILANFSIDRTRYSMTNFSGQPRLPDICYDLVSGSHYVPTVEAGNSSDSHLADEALACVKVMLAKGYIRPSQDSGLFGELLAKLGASEELSNYFIKPVSTITAAEAYAFRSSSLSAFMAERLIPGMAAADEEDDADIEEDETDEDTDDTDEGDTSTDDAGTDDTTLDTGEDDTAADEKEAPAEEEKPHIDPDRMLLELANPKQPMSEYIYRETVARRISDILRNPPENAMPNDLLMLKRWRSRWLYLVNIPCLRDFLTRLSLRLSDV